jgi:predicted branched-subunit amino acid permease
MPPSASTTVTTPRPVRPVRPSSRPRGHIVALPIIAGYVPFGLVLGATTSASSLPTWLALLVSPLVFAGAAQLALVEVLEGGGGVLGAALAALAINLRHLLYSADLAPWFHTAPPRWRWAAPFVLTDPQYLLAARWFPDLPDDTARRRFYLELGLTFWTAWTAMNALGILVGDLLPAGLPLSVLVPLTFLGLLVPSLQDRPAIGAALVGGTVAVLTGGLPLHLNLLVGALAGMTAGLYLENHDA